MKVFRIRKANVYVCVSYFDTRVQHCRSPCQAVHMLRCVLLIYTRLVSQWTLGPFVPIHVCGAPIIMLHAHTVKQIYVYTFIVWCNMCNAVRPVSIANFDVFVLHFTRLIAYYLTIEFVFAAYRMTNQCVYMYLLVVIVSSRKTFTIDHKTLTVLLTPVPR